MRGVGTQIIETERLIMRPIESGDALSIYTNWASDPLVTRFLTWDAHASLAVTQQYVEYKLKRNTGAPFIFDWIIVLKETGEPIGEMEAVNISQQDSIVEMGDCLGAKYWNKGYATEALKAFIKYMFEKAGVEKVTACHISTNPASGRVMQKAGMHLDAVLKGYLVDKPTGKRADKVYYSIDREDL